MVTDLFYVYQDTTHWWRHWWNTTVNSWEISAPVPVLYATLCRWATWNRQMAQTGSRSTMWLSASDPCYCRLWGRLSNRWLWPPDRRWLVAHSCTGYDSPGGRGSTCNRGRFVSPAVGAAYVARCVCWSSPLWSMQGLYGNADKKGLFMTL